MHSWLSDLTRGPLRDPSPATVALATELASTQRDLEAANRRVASLRESLAEVDAANARLRADLDAARAVALREVQPTGPVHPQCRDAAGRVCTVCAPRLGLPARDSVDLAIVQERQRAWIAERAGVAGTGGVTV